MEIKCGPKVDGVRPKVNCQCDEKCPHWEECLKEINIKELTLQFILVDPDKWELLFSPLVEDYLGRKKVWRLVAKDKNKKRKIIL